MTADELPTSASCVYVMSMFIKTNFAQCLAFLQHSARSQCTCMHFSPNLQLRTATNVACSVRVYCLSVRQSSDPAKTAEPTEMDSGSLKEPSLRCAPGSTLTGIVSFGGTAPFDAAAFREII